MGMISLVSCALLFGLDHDHSGVGRLHVATFGINLDEDLGVGAVGCIHSPGNGSCAELTETCMWRMPCDVLFSHASCSPAGFCSCIL